ncbi:hypothetical protein LY78DRAFT_448833 [Colletotrichum sublineola]|nr:hypothetical protein LY78DRAFT_448833 [Colletotrichum sublineola]
MPFTSKRNSGGWCITGPSQFFFSSPRFSHALISVSSSCRPRRDRSNITREPQDVKRRQEVALACHSILAGFMCRGPFQQGYSRAEPQGSRESPKLRILCILKPFVPTPPTWYIQLLSSVYVCDVHDNHERALTRPAAADNRPPRLT